MSVLEEVEIGENRGFGRKKRNVGLIVKYIFFFYFSKIQSKGEKNSFPSNRFFFI